jgi:hypothetical protein
LTIAAMPLEICTTPDADEVALPSSVGVGKCRASVVTASAM